MRSREFDEELVLQKSMRLFCEKGFHATSMSDLLEATGLHKGSLYRAFESKEKLFLKVLEKYGDGTRLGFFKDQKDQSPLLYIKEFFERKIQQGLDKKRVLGCLIFNSCMEFGADRGCCGDSARGWLDEIEANLRGALNEARRRGEIDDKLDLERAVNRLLSATFAIVEMAKFRRDKKLLKDIADGALEVLGLSI